MAAHKKGVKNLIRPTSERAREIGRLGGLKYAENMRRRKALKAIANDLLFSELSIPDELKKHEEVMKSYGFDVYCAADIIMFACLRKAIQGDYKAIELLMNVTGELKKDNNINIDIDIDRKDEITLESVVNEKKRLISLLENSDGKDKSKTNRAGDPKAGVSGASLDSSKAGGAGSRRKKDKGED